MKTRILFFLAGFLLLAATGIAQPPAITAPTTNGNTVTVDPANWVVSGTLGRGSVLRVRVLVFGDSDPNISLLSRTTSTPSSTASTPFTFNLSNPSIDIPYDNPLRVVIYTSTLSSGGQATFTQSSFILVNLVVPVSPSPTITSPANNATVSSCGFNVEVSAITPPPSDGRTYRIAVQYKKSADPEPAYSANTLPQPPFGSSTNFGPYTVSIPSGSLLGSTAYDIRALYQVFDPAANGGIGGFVAYGVASPVTNVTTDAAANANPVVTFPTDGATGISTTPTIQVAAYAGCGTLTTATIEVDRGSLGSPANWINPDFQSAPIANNSNGPFTYTPAVELDYNTAYQIRVRFTNTFSQTFETITSFTTQPITPTDPILNSPADQFTATLCSDVVLTVNANNVAAQRLQVKVYPNGNAPGAIFDQTYNFTNATQATTSFDVTVLRTLFTPGVQYLIELTSRTATNEFIGQKYNTLNTSNTASVAANTPVITSPTDGGTVNTFTPTIQIQSPFAGCTLNSVLYEILPGTVGNTVVSSQTFNTPTYAWTVPVFLTAGATYRARVTYNTAIGSFSDTNTFTVSATPVVSIASPLDLTNLNPCGFPVTVARYPSANAVQVEYKLAADATYSAPFLSTVETPSGYDFAFNNTQLQPNASYNMRITAGTVTAGVFTPITSSAAVFNFTTGDISGNLTPTLASPANGATGVSLTPTITFGAYQGTCGAVTSYIVTIVPAGQAFDAPSPNRIYQNSPTNGFVLNTSLQAGITYKIRASTIVTLNGKEVFPVNYDDGSYTFTTINPNETRLDLVTSASNTVGGIIYLNSEVQTIQVLAVPGATEYAIQLSTDSTFATAQYTATSSTTTFTFNANATGLESSTRYFVRARITQPTVGLWTSAPNIRSFVNSLHPTYADRPVGNIAANATKLRGWHARNATSMFFQIATDASFTNLVDAAGPYGPILTDPAGSGIAYERYSYRRWVGSNLTFVAIENASDAGFAPFNTLGEYDYVRHLIPGQTYYIRVKNVRRAPNGTYLQTGYWAGVASFTPAAATRTHSISLLGAPSAVPVNLVDNTPYIQTNPQDTWNVLEREVQLSTVSDFSSILLTRSDFGGGPGFILNTTLSFSTDYFMRVRSRAANDPGGPLVWTPWSSTFAFRTMDPASGRVAAAAMSTDGSQLVQTVAFPNPFVDDVAVSVKSTYKAVTLSLVDANGRVVDSANTLGGYTVLLGRKQLARGLYVIRITDESGLLETLKVVKQ